ncbi:MAG TPA: NADP-dependent oxidoreductase, partial [Chthoniobacteraceae bacterium]|nr:NADP-dependent oxidoreductase [Chthoniobacteraceae bacterium]
MEEIPKPSAGNGEVLVKVEACGVNPVDTKIRCGEFSRYIPCLPATLGRDISGTVVEVTGDVAGIAKGDAVFGMLDYDRGAYAEYATAGAMEIARKPAGLSFEEAAALPVPALTAWQALFEFGRLKAGQRVLIHGAGGGVGHFAVQFAVLQGAQVIATCGKEDLEFVRELGAEHAIDYKAEKFENDASGIDLVVDLVAGDTRKRSWQILRPGGILVSTLPGPKPEGRSDVSGREVVVHQAPWQLSEIAAL